MDNHLHSFFPPAIIIPINQIFIEFFQYIKNQQEIKLAEYKLARNFFCRNPNPLLLINNQQFTINRACLKCFPHIDYIQILINAEEHKLLIFPCSNIQKNSFKWVSGKKRNPAKIKSKIFLGKLYKIMNWDIKYQYVCAGKMIYSDFEIILMFDLSSPILRIDSTICDQDKKYTLVSNCFDNYVIFGESINKERNYNNEQENRI